MYYSEPLYLTWLAKGDINSRLSSPGADVHCYVQDEDWNSHTLLWGMSLTWLCDLITSFCRWKKGWWSSASRNRWECLEAGANWVKCSDRVHLKNPRRYPGLGHSLSSAKARIERRFFKRFVFSYWTFSSFSFTHIQQNLFLSQLEDLSVACG